MKLLNLYKKALNESHSESCIAKYGKDLFAQQLGGVEPNTDIENGHLNQVQKFTDSDFGFGLSPEIIDAMGNLKTCIKQYPDVLLPNDTVVYRGVRFSLGHFIKNNILLPLEKPINHKLKSSAVIQSWSEDIKIAEGFGGAFLDEELWEEFINDFKKVDGRGEKAENMFYKDKVLKKYLELEIPILISTKTNPDNFLFKGNVMNKLSSSEGESEVIRVGNEPIDVELIVPKRQLSIYSFKALKLINDILEYGYEQ